MAVLYEIVRLLVGGNRQSTLSLNPPAKIVYLVIDLYNLLGDFLFPLGEKIKKFTPLADRASRVRPSVSLRASRAPFLFEKEAPAPLTFVRNRGIL